MYDWYSRMSEKTALVLSAGGMFGAYQAGAWQELSAGFHPDMVIGTSVGALNGWLIAGGCPPDELIRSWADPSAGGFLQLRNPLDPWNGIFDYDSFATHVRRLFSSCRPRIPFALVLTDLLRLRPRLVQSDEMTWEHLAASCAIPLGLPPMRIDGRLYVDGGLLNVLPLWPATEMGATRAVAINALPRLPLHVMRGAAGVLRWISPKGPAPGALEVASITPAAGLGTVSEAVRWNRERILRWIERGAEDARRVMATERPGRDSTMGVLQ
jgi:NTE family protein